VRMQDQVVDLIAVRILKPDRIERALRSGQAFVSVAPASPKRYLRFGLREHLT
jgi:hypothetical protein